MSKNLPSNWSSIKKKWKQKNEPNDEGYYVCWVCKQPVHLSTMTLDHVFPLAQYPEYAAELSNLEPSHEFCNQHRGGSGLINKVYKAKKKSYGSVRRKW